MSQKTIEDLGEVAQLATELVASLDNLPQEVQHIIKEVEHKDAKVQEMLPKLAAREAQLRELLMRKEVLTDFDKAKVEKLNEKIKVDYARADEWSSQKETLSKELWRSIVAHQRRLEVEMDKISPALIKQVENTLPAHSYLSSATSLSSIAAGTSLSGISSILANLKSPSVEVDSLHGSSNGSSLKRKHGLALARESPSHSTKQSRHPSTDRTSSPSLTIPSNAFIPPASYPLLSKKAMKNSGLSSMLAKVESTIDPDADLDADGDADGSGDPDKDTKLYCHCQRVSFGEMIGCDSDECPYEWFHLSCVGLSKPLPQTWFCEDCKARIEREKSEKPAKKRKR